MEAFIFKELETNPQEFFEILPQDWQDEIVPFWNDFTTDAKIYSLEDNTNIIGGGIVFYKSPPSFKYFESEAKDWFDKGYLYLGFIWIAEEHRNKNLGSFWLDQLKTQNINRHFFLLTEEDYLQHFYEKNGFIRVKSVRNEDYEESLYITKNEVN